MSWKSGPCLTPNADEIDTIVRRRLRDSMAAQGGLGLITTDSEGYIYPKWQEIAAVLKEGWENRYRKKVEIGFDTILIIPGGVELSKLVAALTEAVQKSGNRLQSMAGEEVVLNRKYPLSNAWSENALYQEGDCFFPRDQYYLRQRWPGFLVGLINLRELNVLRWNEGGGFWGDRRDLEGGKSSSEYYSMLGRSPYDYEEALNMDGNLVLYAESLGRDLVLDVYRKDSGTVILCPSNALPVTVGREVAEVAQIYTDPLFEKICLGRCEVCTRYPNHAVRTIVPIGNA